jgi:hypothetical protein
MLPLPYCRLRACNGAFDRRFHDNNIQEQTDMGKYVLAWFLGVPAIVLVIIYLIAS